MIRRLLVVFLIVLISLQQAYAADILWRIMHNDQDALIIGEVAYEVGGSYRIDVKHVISGNLPNKTITITNDFFYNGTETKPVVGDYLVLSLDKKILNYYLKYGAMKATSGDYETLKLHKEDLPSSLQGDYTVLEYYINSNGTYKDFYYKGYDIYLSRKDGEDLLIFTIDHRAYTSQNPESNIGSDQIINIVANPSDNQKSFLSSNTVIMAILFTGVLIVIYLFFKKK